MIKKLLTSLVCLTFCFVSFTQVLDIKNLIEYSTIVQEIAKKHGIEFNIDSTNWHGWVNSNNIPIIESKKNLQLFSKYASSAMAGNKSDYKSAIKLIPALNNYYLYSDLAAYKKEFLFFTQKEFFEGDRIPFHGANDLCEILGYLPISDNIKDSLINHNKVPIHVKARLGYKPAEDSLINFFLAEAYDTINYDAPKSNFAYYLFYIGSRKTIWTIAEALHSNKTIYIPQMPRNNIMCCDIWTVYSINEYIIQEFQNFNKYQILNIFKGISVYPIEELKLIRRDSMINNKDNINYFQKKAVLVYSEFMSYFFEKKYHFKFTITYKHDAFIEDNKINPPPSLLKNKNYVRCILDFFYGKEIINDFPEKYEQFKEEFLKSISDFYM